MKRFLIPALIVVLFASACGSPAQIAPQSNGTPDTAAETPTQAAVMTGWVAVTPSSPEAPGWAFQHPEGWETINFNASTVFLYSVPGAGDRLFDNGLQPGDMVFQLSMNTATTADETPESHLAILTERLSETEFSAPQPVSIAGLDGVYQTGVNDSLGFTVVAMSRLYLRGNFLDVFAYSRTDEYETNSAVINTVIENLSYQLATE